MSGSHSKAHLRLGLVEVERQRPGNMRKTTTASEEAILFQPPPVPATPPDSEYDPRTGRKQAKRS